MGAAMGGMSGGQLGMGLLKGGLSGLGQGLQNYNSSQPKPFDFSQISRGVQNFRKPSLGQGVTPNASQQPNAFDPNNGNFPGIWGQ